MIREQISLIQRQAAVAAGDKQADASGQTQLFKKHPAPFDLRYRSAVDMLYYCCCYHWDDTAVSFVVVVVAVVVVVVVAGVVVRVVIVWQLLNERLPFLILKKSAVKV